MRLEENSTPAWVHSGTFLDLGRRIPLRRNRCAEDFLFFAPQLQVVLSTLQALDAEGLVRVSSLMVPAWSW